MPNLVILVFLLIWLLSSHLMLNGCCFVLYICVLLLIYALFMHTHLKIWDFFNVTLGLDMVAIYAQTSFITVVYIQLFKVFCVSWLTWKKSVRLLRAVFFGVKLVLQELLPLNLIFSHHFPKMTIWVNQSWMASPHVFSVSIQKNCCSVWTVFVGHHW